ncbi:MAG: Delta(1)-pyrroline-2-carboxylate/Delta(1)-piperideine-2-carboxylate reductase [Alphaproteobacteria bacterium MarineAlpha5_Bin5]|mgnify:FL=1|nr:MAG: Delta(1)-pyrroline-2-carboxylate/Delta(1)-piperideine-2-carboxylate reductase [Alphaproteobacteria bacterium MarineAlpha5_Bin5]PPR49825.1 MAG: Delta(1)-pyrroline-2-carboxylate/Delta(1)-piperideine-2-carboxylate reductase [Alphaproteobacteria bacterium MarineAlpha5_Bin4]|tara:strand:- start:273 stop:1274 length:1002 start_codon:yes stop_codon:yes gene_type:complete
MTTTNLTLEEIYNLALKTLKFNGCDELNAEAVADTVTNAERDGSVSHGLFRIPGYIASLKSKKVKGNARPTNKFLTQNAIRVDGDYGFAPTAIKVGLPVLIETTEKHGVGVLTIANTHHFAALWHETESLAEKNLIGIACTAYKPSVAPAGAKKPLFGTNPISFAWPRKNNSPVVYDMATSTMAMGEVQVAARDGHKVPYGTGLNKDGKKTDNPADIANGGVLLTFGDYKGSAIAMMIELLAAGLVGDLFSFEAAKEDNNDGGPARGGEFIMALSPNLIAGENWNEHSEKFFQEMKSLEGVRLPGERRHKNRLNTGSRSINKELVDKIISLSE